MQTLPKEISERFERLKKERKNRLVLSLIKGRFCVYEYKYVFDTKKQRKRTVSFYIGAISGDGEFREALHRKPSTKVSSINLHIRAIEEEGSGKEAHTLVHPDSLDREILTELSMDSRMSVNEIAKRLGISQSTAGHRIRELVKNYGVRKTIEIYPERFGFTRYYAVVRFLGTRPDNEAMKKIFENEPRVQLAAAMHGRYGLFIYIIAESTLKLEDIIYGFRSQAVFKGCPAIWNVGYMLEGYGFIPLRESFFDLLNERVWRKTKETRRKLENQLLPSEYAVMKEMSADAGIEFANIDRDHNLNSGSAQYTYYRLMEKKLLERSTITMTAPKSRYCCLIYAQQRDISAFNSTRINFLRKIIEETDYPTNRHIFYGDVSAAYGGIFITPIYDEDPESVKKGLTEGVGGIKTSLSIITSILVGELGFRRFDNEYSLQISLLSRAINNK
jgi:DNA-binding Lrp family transcriptional regulator